MYFWKTEQGKIVMSLPSMSCPTPLAERMGSFLMRWRCDAQNVQVTCTVSKEKRLLTLVKSSRCIKTKWNKKNKGGMVGIKPFKIPELRKKKKINLFFFFSLSASVLWNYLPLIQEASGGTILNIGSITTRRLCITESLDRLICKQL